jgi:hypothetical protein
VEGGYKDAGLGMSGATLRMRFIDTVETINTQDQYGWIGWDELTSWGDDLGLFPSRCSAVWRWGGD